jgi:hypothetical protein
MASGPTTLIITLTGGAGTVTIAIPQALQNLDATAPGAVPTGFSSADQLIRAIFRAGVFFDGSKTWYAASQIASIQAQ